MVKLNMNLSKAKEMAEKAIDSATPIAKKALEGASVMVEDTKTFTKEKVIPGAVDAKNKIVDVSGKAVDATRSAAVEAKDKVFNAVDVNGDGQIGIDDVIIMALQVPGVRINRTEFLRKEFLKNHSKEQIEDIIKYNPAHAGIKVEEVDKIADEVIKFERTCVSGISAALGTPGGFAMAATIPADISQYYGYMLRAAQKLMYLYGFPQIEIDKDGDNVIDTEIMNTLIICLGVMYGVAGAKGALQAMAKGLAAGVEKKLMAHALTKGTIYPIVKSVAKWFNVKMTKEVFAGFFKKSIPVIGGAIGGGITYVSFKPCCDKLKETLRCTALSDPEKYQDPKIDLLDVIDIDEIDVK